MIRRLLCAIGFHHMDTHPFGGPYEYQGDDIRICRHCHRVKETY